MTAFRATYRLMFGEHLRFADARRLIPYLADLGVSHLYLPPSFQARRGSTHGYDVVDPNAISRELGGEEEFRALCDAAHRAGLGVVLDIVPNHMATDEENRYWTQERPKYFDVDSQTGFYRRFFDIDHLAGVRQEDRAVFEETHGLVRRLLKKGWVDGLRVDHPDGLADPLGYLEQLKADHVWVEKILATDEQLRPDWPVEGTVGYEFLNEIQGLFVDPAAEEPLTELWEEISGDRRSFAAWAFEAKLEQASTTFSREVEWLRRDWPEMPLGIDLERALASLPVYRTYVRDGVASEEDRAVLVAADLEWLLDAPPAFVTRFQQTTPPVMAKGVEDTAFYRYARLVALNDVGGDPARFGVSVAEFHRANLERPAHNLLITSTHDTKRSGDARARAGAIASLPHAWSAFVRERIDDDSAPDAIEQYFLMQNLAAAYPLAAGRTDVFVEKALREAKRHSSWADPDRDYEAAVKQWARDLDVTGIAHELARVGDRHALGQLLLKLTCPGVPDIYNGDEVRMVALVDPDNRRPVDWDVVRHGDAKSELIRTVLHERIKGEYEPIDAREGTIAFSRGGRWHVAVALREDIEVPRLTGEVVFETAGMRVTRT